MVGRRSRLSGAKILEQEVLLEGNQVVQVVEKRREKMECHQLEVVIAKAMGILVVM